MIQSELFPGLLTEPAIAPSFQPMAASKDRLGPVFALCRAQDHVLLPPQREQMEVPAELWATFKALLIDNHGKWVGGNKQHFIFPFPVAGLLSDFQSGLRPSFKKDYHYFPTPPDIVDFMFNIEMPLYDGRFLEPSAGQGAIIEQLNAMGARHHNQTWDCCEIHPLNRQKLADKGFNLIGSDFMQMTVSPDYDAIYANPPFKDIVAHIRKMPNHLVKNGSIICVIPTNFPEKVIAELAPLFTDINTYAVPAGAFKASGTMVGTKILHCADFRGKA